MYKTIGLLTLWVPPDHMSDTDSLVFAVNASPNTFTTKDCFSDDDLKGRLLGFTLTLI